MVFKRCSIAYCVRACLVRDYHKAFYRPDNLCLIINGKIKPEEVFPVLESFEEKIVSKVLHKALSCSPLSRF